MVLMPVILGQGCVDIGVHLVNNGCGRALILPRRQPIVRRRKSN